MGIIHHIAVVIFILRLFRWFWEPKEKGHSFQGSYGEKRARKRKQRHKSAQRVCFRYTDSTIPLLPKFKISSLQPSSVSIQPGLSRTWSETPKPGFLTTRLICSHVFQRDEDENSFTKWYKLYIIIVSSQQSSLQKCTNCNGFQTG